ncbi:hypothetical protein ACG91_31580, partial [Pseudomonas aeruginosa]
MLIEAFVPELTVERLDEGILRGLTRLNQLQLDVALIGHLIRRPVLSASKTKSIDQTWFGALGKLRRSRSTAT